MTLAMTHAGYIIVGWLATFLAIALYVGWTIVKGRRLAARFDRDELPWG